MPALAIETNEWRRSPRRVRVHFGGVRVADSARTMLLRQHGFLPIYYSPAQDVRTELLVPTDYTTHSPYKGTASYWHLRSAQRTAQFAVWSYAQPKPGSPDTRGYYGFDWHSMDAWYEEDERLYVHARDPCCAWTRCAARGKSGSRSAARPSRNRAARCCSSRRAW